MTSSQDALARIARTFRTRVRRGDPAPVAETRFRRGSLQFTMLAEALRILIEVRGFTKAPMMFSLNHQDQFKRDAIPIDMVGATSVLTYTHLRNLDVLRPWLDNAYNRALISALSLDSEEYVHVYENGIDASVLPENATPELVAGLEALVAALPARADASLDGITDMPARLQALAPLFADWAIGDDEQRDRRISHASQRRLRKVRDAVEPLIPEINAYLDSFGNKPLTPAALQLQNLALVVAELRAREA